MKIKIRFFSLIIILALTLMFSVHAFAGYVFSDIDNVISKDKIIALSEKGIVKGYGDGKFSPDNNITAAESIQLFVNTFNLNLDNIRFIKEPKASDYFTNADDNAWYANAFIIASVKGLELPKDLDPEKQCSKEEFTYYLISAMEKYNDLPKINIVPKEISDDKNITIEYSGAIQRALFYGVANLDEDKGFNPKANITRAQAAEQIYNALEYIKAHPAPKIS